MVVPAKAGGVYVAVVSPEPPTTFDQVASSVDSSHCNVIPGSPEEPATTKFEGVVPLNKI